MVDREQLADFLRRRRESLQPEDVGLTRGPRRRTNGLRREEVAALSGMSVDYYSRLEQERGPQPSEQMTAAIARGLHLSLDERDHLFRLAGHNAPVRTSRSEHVSPGMLRILDRLQDTPAQVVTGLAETLVQTPLAAALLGNETNYTGLARSMTYRWFTDDPDARRVYPIDDHPIRSRLFTSDLRSAYSREGAGSRAEALVEALLARSAEFEALWSEHEVGLAHDRMKRIQHPELGVLELDCQILLDPDQAQALLVFTATPGSESYEKLQLLSVIGEQRMSS
jgi:transcriptional regulator with XRE-family HTH domain